MRKFIFIATLAAAGQLFAEVIPVKSYKFEFPVLASKRDSYSDKQFTKLNNGGTAHDPLVLDFKSSTVKTASITFTLENPANLTAVDFDIFRGPRSFGWKTVKIYGIEEENKTLLGEKTYNHPYNLPQDAKSREKLQVELKSDKKFSTVEITFTVTGSYLGLTEVSFTGSI